MYVVVPPRGFQWKQGSGVSSQLSPAVLGTKWQQKHTSPVQAMMCCVCEEKIPSQSFAGRDSWQLTPALGWWLPCKSHSWQHGHGNATQECSGLREADAQSWGLSALSNLMRSTIFLAKPGAASTAPLGMLFIVGRKRSMGAVIPAWVWEPFSHGSPQCFPLRTQLNVMAGIFTLERHAEFYLSKWMKFSVASLLGKILCTYDGVRLRHTISTHLLRTILKQMQSAKMPRQLWPLALMKDEG